MSDMLLTQLKFKDLKLMPVSAGQITMMGCFENKSISSICKDTIIQWQFHKVKIRGSDCPEELYSKVTCIVNRKLE